MSRRTIKVIYKGGGNFVTKKIGENKIAKNVQVKDEPLKNSECKGTLHPRNLHHGRYDFSALCRTLPELSAFLKDNPKGDQTVDFSDQKAVLCLNRALLTHYYQIKYWEIPKGYLCPPIPGRADYLHYLADLPLLLNQDGTHNKSVHVLDIGTGANCIYPIVGVSTYGWQFTASDIDKVSVKSATAIVNSNPSLKGRVKVVHQTDKHSFFRGVIQADEYYDFTLCNPPFYASLKEAQESSERKLRNLNKKKSDSTIISDRNFGGQKAELWCSGGEIVFLKNMAKESVLFSNQVGWFSSLVSKAENIRPLKKLLTKLGATEIRTIKMSQGQKVSRMIVWCFR